MDIDLAGIEFIEKWEGCSLVPYKDSGGLFTIGFGHLILPNQQYLMKGITQEQAETLLRFDLITTQNCLNKCVKVSVSQDQWNALSSLTYNIGTGAFMESTLLKVLNEGNYVLAASHFLDWVYVNKEKVSGLVARRQAEKDLFTNGQ